MEGLLVFILEADASTSIELDAIASHLGCQKIAAFHYCEIAERWLEHFTPDLAIVDPSVERRGCAKLVAMLDNADVPLILYSSSPPSEAVRSTRKKSVVHLPNPSPPHIILTAMESVLTGRETGSIETDITKEAELPARSDSPPRRLD